MNRASRYVPLAGSQAAGAPGLPAGEEVKSPAAERTTPPLNAAKGTAAGHDPQAGIMIPTLMTRHRVKRPAISMEGGTKKHILRSGLPRRRLSFAFENTVISLFRTTQEGGFCRFYSFHRETHLGGKHYAAVFSWPYGRRFFWRLDHVPHANGPET